MAPADLAEPCTQLLGVRPWASVSDGCLPLNHYVVKYIVKDTIKITSVKDTIKNRGSNVPINVPHELNRADKRILEQLQNGVRNPSWLADELDYSRQYVHQRLQLLVAAEFVEDIGHGLYELIELPEKSDQGK